MVVLLQSSLMAAQIKETVRPNSSLVTPPPCRLRMIKVNGKLWNCFSEGISESQIGQKEKELGKKEGKMGRNGDDIIKPRGGARWWREHGKSVKGLSSG